MKYYITILLLFLSTFLTAQGPTQNPEAVKKALDLISEAQKLAPNELWPKINPELFFKNLKENIQNPYYINQGKPTNLCGFAAITHFLVITEPDKYVRMVLEIYRTGKTQVNDRTLVASNEIQQAAGNIDIKGILSINHADQLWFLTLGDNYKGYLNLFHKTYKSGDEDTFWASTNYKKFNTILKSLTTFSVRSKGSDLLKPKLGHYYNFIKEKNREHTVLLYLNNKALYPNRFFRLLIPTPTHYVVLYNLDQNSEKHTTLDYWDYGLRTKILLKDRKFRKLIYGITYVNIK